MSRITIVSGVVMLLSLFHAKMLTVRTNHDPGSCSQSNHGELILVKDRENKDTIVVCTEDNGVYSWRKTDDSKPSGEYFNPGYDCLQILKQNSRAKDGFYWVNFHKRVAKKIYCDMSTDGGGYMLIGHMNDTVTWDVPSSNKTVEPFGYPQWSSDFGDVPVLDFRIQVALDEDFENTKAHWAFRFKEKRLLKNLMIVDHGGCPYNFPGVGDVSYVKDLMTDEIVSKNYSCSIFGPYSHPRAKIGWTMMNSCFNKPCRNGFAYHPLFPIQVAFTGGFSFVATESNRKKGSTGFFGCDKGKCCACYGPAGGRDVYCLKECQSRNGGTVTKHASSWFWVRLNPPRKVFEKCMEYKIKEQNGDSAWYKMIGDSKLPAKVVVLKNGDDLKNIPAISGQLAYREDDQSLLFKKNNTWKVLAEEEMLTKINEHLVRMSTLITKKLFNGSSEISSCKSLAELNPYIPSGEYFIAIPHLPENPRRWSSVKKKTQSGKRRFKVYCDFPSGWTLFARLSNKDYTLAKKKDNRYYLKALNKNTADPTPNQDMVSLDLSVFLSGNEIKITRNDDPLHTALAETTNNCLQGNSFFTFVINLEKKARRMGKLTDQCLGSCKIRYGGQYQSTTGFEMHNCNGNMQSSDHVGFVCNSSSNSSALVMIGGAGKECDTVPFSKNYPEMLDFGVFRMNNDSRYALNMWIR